MLQAQKQVKVRDSSIELLRILAMIFVVFHHFAYHGGFEWASSSLSVTRFYYNFIVMGGKLGVNVFVLISGYYLIHNDRKIFDISKTVKFVGQVWFYSVAILIVSVICGLESMENIGIRSCIETLFPITFSQWWFASAYFVLYLIHPFLNILLRGMDKALYQKLILLLVVCWSIIPTFTTSYYQSNSFLWFVTLYVIAGYLRLYGLNDRFTAKHYTVFFLVCSVLSYASSAVFTVLGSRWPIFASRVTYFYEQEKITTLLIAVSLFMIFATVKIKYHKWINVIASATFGVYLIHDNSIIRRFLWADLFKNAQYQESLLLIPYSIAVVAAVYISCSAIDLFRQYVIEKPCMILVKRLCEKRTKSENGVVSFVKNLIFGKSSNSGAE